MKIHTFFLFLLFLFFHSNVSADINNLFSAAILGKTERIKSLLADGDNVNGKTATGRTAMMAASFNGNKRVVRILLAYGADVNIADNFGTTALMDAIVFGSEPLVKLLITAGADVVAKDNQGISVIDKAKMTQFHNLVTVLEKAIALKEGETDATSSENPLTETKEKAEENKDSQNDNPEKE